MSMVKKSVVSEANVSVIGASVDEKNENSAICVSCSRVVLGNQIKKDGECPFCHASLEKGMPTKA